jgi:hypothetical protein
MGAWVAIFLLGQLDAGLSVPPPPPDVAPEVPGVDNVFPRVVRVAGQVCVESLDDYGGVQRACRPEGSEAPRRSRAAEKEPLARGVADLAVHAGVLIVGAAVPEFVFMADAGVRLRNGVGVVGFLHGHVTSNVFPAASRYGVGVGLRLGDRSHILIGTSATFEVLGATGALVPALTVLVRFALVFAKYFAVLLMPSFTFSGQGAMGSLALGAGLTF